MQVSWNTAQVCCTALAPLVMACNIAQSGRVSALWFSPCILCGYVLKTQVPFEADSGHWQYNKINCIRISFDMVTTANARSRTSDYCERRLLIEDVYLCVPLGTKSVTRRTDLVTRGTESSFAGPAQNRSLEAQNRSLRHKIGPSKDDSVPRVTKSVLRVTDFVPKGTERYTSSINSLRSQ